MNTMPLTARIIADRIGRGLVRASYPPTIDEHGENAGTIILRACGPDGEPLQMFYVCKDPIGPHLTDFGITYSTVTDAAGRPSKEDVEAAIRGTGVHFDGVEMGALWTETDVGWPEEDACELVAVMIRLTGYAIGRRRSPPTRPRRPHRKPPVR